jgi:hypothetical protein
MKAKHLIIIAVAAMLATQAWAQSPKMKMTTPVIPSLTTPDLVETPVGSFEFLMAYLRMNL